MIRKKLRINMVKINVLKVRMKERKKGEKHEKRNILQKKDTRSICITICILLFK